MISDANKIAECVLSAFDALPQKYKPRIYPDGNQEWTTLCGIVLSRAPDEYCCVALGTGLKCLPHLKIPQAKGLCLHDSHAEVVAIRALNLYLLRECSQILTSPGYISPYLRRSDPAQSHDAPFTISPNVTISMYSSTAPCGDASMELTMAAQEDDTPWQEPLSTEDNGTLMGRGHFAQLGVVRRKPGRGDAPISLSKSCSDKIALKQCTSLLMSLTSLLVCPEHAYIHQLVLPDNQYCESAVVRAFGPEGRMQPLAMSLRQQETKWREGYQYQPFSVQTTDRVFRYAKECGVPVKNPTGSNITAMVAGQDKEVLVNGTLQGRKQFSVAGGSAICRKRMWQLSSVIQSLLACDDKVDLSGLRDYASIKHCQQLDARREVKSHARLIALKGWQPNTGDDEFKIDCD